MQGKGLILNGSSSAGKTTLSKQLQQSLDEDYLIFSIDSLYSTGPDYFFVDDPWLYYTDEPFTEIPQPNLNSVKLEQLLTKSFPKLISGFHHCIESLIMTGNNVIIDTGFHKMGWLKECINLLHPYEVFMIGVFCSPEELVRREMSRGDRPKGMAMYQHHIVHREVIYDLKVNTSEQSLEEITVDIKEYITNNKPLAISEMRKNFA